MKYSIGQLAKLSGVSTRTLRFYDEINLLRPAEVLPNGYRQYGVEELALLHQILVYRELGFELNDIKEMVSTDGVEHEAIMVNHLQLLQQEKERIERLIQSVETVMRKNKEGIAMNEKDFEAFKREKLEGNEAKYGKEIREKYGEDTINQSNQHFSKLDQTTYKKIEALTTEINDLLKVHVANNNPSGPEGQKIAKKHADFLRAAWPKGLFDEEKHLGLAYMYTQDERFKDYYENIAEGATDYLLEAVKVLYGK